MSFRSPQIDAFGLDPRATLDALLAYPFQVIRLGAYWNRLEPAEGAFEPRELDWQIDTAESAGRQIILAVGAVKTFGYPEVFVPAHRLERPLPEHALITPITHPELLDAACDVVTRVVDRYRGRTSIVAWQVEHEAVDPLGIEHSWRLARDFVAREVAAVRLADPTRPILLNGFLPASLLGQLAQGWQTRDQGDSLSVARSLADVVGVDYYPRYALATIGPLTVYLDGSKSPWANRRLRQLLQPFSTNRLRLMVTEGQAEPWETITIPPSPARRGMASCLPEHLIRNYNDAMRWSREIAPLDAYLFWGAEYWLLRERGGDSSYVRAFARVLEHS